MHFTKPTQMQDSSAHDQYLSQRTSFAICQCRKLCKKSLRHQWF